MGLRVTATPRAASNTPALAITSLREQSHTDRMLRSSDRCRQSDARTEALAPSATRATTDMISRCRSNAARPLEGHLDGDADREGGHDAAFQQRTPSLPDGALPD